MRRSALAVAASAAAFIALALPRTAHALGPLDIEGDAKIGAGTHELGFGAGGRAGVSIIGIYGGLSLVDYVGSSPNPHLLTYGGEVGFGFKVWRLTIRSLFGFGNATESASGFPSESTLYLEPGGLLQVKVFSVLTVGLDASCFILPSAPQAQSASSGGSSAFYAFTMHGQVGVQF